MGLQVYLFQQHHFSQLNQGSSVCDLPPKTVPVVKSELGKNMGGVADAIECCYVTLMLAQNGPTRSFIFKSRAGI